MMRFRKIWADTLEKEWLRNVKNTTEKLHCVVSRKKVTRNKVNTVAVQVAREQTFQISPFFFLLKTKKISRKIQTFRKFHIAARQNNEWRRAFIWPADDPSEQTASKKWETSGWYMQVHWPRWWLTEKGASLASDAIVVLDILPDLVLGSLDTTSTLLMAATGPMSCLTNCTNSLHTRSTLDTPGKKNISLGFANKQTACRPLTGLFCLHLKLYSQSPRGNFGLQMEVLITKSWKRWHCGASGGVVAHR